MSLNRLLALPDSLSLNILSHSQENYLIFPLSPPVVYTLTDDLVHCIIKKMEIRWLDGGSSSSLLGWQSYPSFAPVSPGSCSCGGTVCLVNYYPCFLSCRGSAPVHTETRLCLWSGSESSLPPRPVLCSLRLLCQFQKTWTWNGQLASFCSLLLPLPSTLFCLHFNNPFFFPFFFLWDKFSL